MLEVEDRVRMHLSPRDQDGARPIGRRRLVREANASFNYPGAPSRLQLQKDDMGPQPNKLPQPTVFTRMNGRAPGGLDCPVPGRTPPERELCHSLAGQFTMSPRGIRKALRQRRQPNSDTGFESLEDFLQSSGPFEVGIHRAEVTLLSWLNSTVHLDTPLELVPPADTNAVLQEDALSVVERSPARMVWDVPNNYLRFACHALCRYHNVVSFSRDELRLNSKGEPGVRRLMNILRPHVTRLHPGHATDPTDRSGSKAMRRGVRGRARRNIGGLETPPDTGSEVNSELETLSTCSDIASEPDEFEPVQEDPVPAVDRSLEMKHSLMQLVDGSSEPELRRARPSMRRPPLQLIRQRSESSETGIDGDVEDAEIMTAETSRLSLADETADEPAASVDVGQTTWPNGAIEPHDVSNGLASTTMPRRLELIPAPVHAPASAIKSQRPRQTFTEYLFLS